MIDSPNKKRKYKVISPRQAGAMAASRQSRVWRKEGLCPNCGGTRAPGRTFCPACVEKVQEKFSYKKKPALRKKAVKSSSGKVYFIQAVNGGPVKIGWTSDEKFQNRLSGLQTGNPYRLQVIGTMEGDQQVERSLHKQFQHLRLCGEWFENTDELMEFIQPYRCRIFKVSTLKWEL
jgi:hypothetical protein